MNNRIKKSLLALHRWVGVVLTPLFLLIILSGAILALKPILASMQHAPAGVSQKVDTGALLALLEEWDMAGDARALVLAPDGRTATLMHPADPAASGRFTVADGRRLADAGTSYDFFDIVKSLHKGLLIGAEPLVEIASYAMLIILVAGPLLAWPRLGHTLMGWHMALGWWLWPLLLMLPLTGVLMSLHVGMPPMPRMSEPGTVLSLADGLRRAEAAVDLTGLEMVRRFRHGTVLVVVRDGSQVVNYVVTDQQVAALGGYLPKSLHEGTWGGPWGAVLNLLGSLGLAGLTGTGFVAWLRRRRLAARRDEDAGADLLVAYASQTGTAARLAEATVKALRAVGERVSLASLGALTPQAFAAYPQSLLIVSTTGDGALPDAALPFVERLEPTALTGARFALLALGDRHYARFCAGGEHVHAALLDAGAKALAPLERVDGPVEAPWRAWLGRIANERGWRLGELTSPGVADQVLRVRLQERQRLDRPLAGQPAHESHSVVLACAAEVAFRPGDLLLVRPDEDAPERCYSIGSSSMVTPGLLRLSVALVHWQDEQGEHFGKTSRLLCRDLRPGQTLTVRLRNHPGFHPPEQAARPLIMAATGCGIAPFMGFLDERAACAERGPSWLLFGNRWRDRDYLYGERLEALHRTGVLQYLDTAFSRDEEHRYVTDRLKERGAELVRWLLEDDAALYVCGRKSTLGRGIDEALRQVLERHAGDTPEAAKNRIAAWAASGKLRRDLFD